MRVESTNISVYEPRTSMSDDFVLRQLFAKLLRKWDDPSLETKMRTCKAFRA